MIPYVKVNHSMQKAKELLVIMVLMMIMVVSGMNVL